MIRIKLANRRQILTGYQLGNLSINAPAVFKLGSLTLTIPTVAISGSIVTVVVLGNLVLFNKAWSIHRCECFCFALRINLEPSSFFPRSFVRLLFISPDKYPFPHVKHCITPFSSGKSGTVLPTVPNTAGLHMMPTSRDPDSALTRD